MAENLVIRNITEVLRGEVLHPAITRYNRLESRPRTDNFTRALRAEVRDALWMLSKQWQMGEFLGDDAGTPVYAKIHVEGQRITKYQPEGDPVQNFDLNTPLEATVERRPVPFLIGSQPIALDLRLQMGRRWLKMIPPSAAQHFRDQYPIVAPDPSKKEEAAVCAHAEVWQQFKAVAGRAMDGAALYLYLKENTLHLASDNIPALTATEKDAADAAGPLFVAWFEKLYFQPQPEEGDAWQPERLEYQFACAVPDGKGGEKVLTAEEYYHERLDWYNFDWDKSRQTLGEAPLPAPESPVEKKYTTQTFIPTPVRFNGMPDTRWWAFEDGKTNFGHAQHFQVVLRGTQQQRRCAFHDGVAIVGIRGVVRIKGVLRRTGIARRARVERHHRRKVGVRIETSIRRIRKVSLRSGGNVHRIAGGDRMTDELVILALCDVDQTQQTPVIQVVAASPAHRVRQRKATAGRSRLLATARVGIEVAVRITAGAQDESGIAALQLEVHGVLIREGVVIHDPVDKHAGVGLVEFLNHQPEIRLAAVARRGCVRAEIKPIEEVVAHAGGVRRAAAALGRRKPCRVIPSHEHVGHSVANDVPLGFKVLKHDGVFRSR